MDDLTLRLVKSIKKSVARIGKSFTLGLIEDLTYEELVSIFNMLLNIEMCMYHGGPHGN